MRSANTPFRASVPSLAAILTFSATVSVTEGPECCSESPQNTSWWLRTGGGEADGPQPPWKSTRDRGAGDAQSHAHHCLLQGTLLGPCQMMALCALLAPTPPLGSSPVHGSQFLGTQLSGQAPGEFGV